MSQWELIVAALALLAGVWSHVKSVAHWLRGFMVATRWMEDDGAATVASYLTRDRRHSAREPVYNMASMHVRPLGRSCWIAYELLSAGGLFWHGRVPIWLREQDKGGRGGPAFKYSFSHIRGTVDWDELVTAAGSWRSDVSRGTGWKTVRHQVHYHHGTSMAAEIDRKNDSSTKTHHSWNRGCGQRLVHWRPEDVGSKNHDGFSTVVLDRSQTALVEEIRRWLDTRDWYEERGIPWRKGLLFDGEPGSGKTTLIRSCAQDMDLPVHLFDLATMSNEELRKAWNEMAQDAPCVAVIEDIDRVFRGDVNITPPSGAMTSGGLTFNALLNCVDGVERCEGRAVRRDHEPHRARRPRVGRPPWAHRPRDQVRRARPGHADADRAPDRGRRPARRADRDRVTGRRGRQVRRGVLPRGTARALRRVQPVPRGGLVTTRGPLWVTIGQLFFLLDLEDRLHVHVMASSDAKRQAVRAAPRRDRRRKTAVVVP